MSARAAPSRIRAVYLAVHRCAAAREVIQGAGAELRSLSPYAPDLNPIEMAFSKFKAFLKRRAARTVSP